MVGCVSDEDIPSSSPLSPINDVAVQENPNEVRIGPMTRACAKLLEQQVNSLLIECDVCDYENFILPKSMHLCMIRVNSLLIEYDVCDYENFILPKSLHLCMIRVIDNTNTCGGGQQGVEKHMEEHMEDHMENKKNKAFKSLREEREAGALEEIQY